MAAKKENEIKDLIGLNQGLRKDAFREMHNIFLNQRY